MSDTSVTVEPTVHSAILEDLPDGVVVADGEGIVRAANSVAARQLGATDPVGRHLRDVMSLDDLEGNTWFDCVRPYDGYDLRSRTAEQTWHCADGNELLVTAQFVRERPRGPVVRVVASLRSARHRARYDRERSDLVATVAHELRSPLTGVKGFVSTLLTKWDRFSEQQRLLMLETIDSDADRLSRLITELLDAARIDSGRLTLRAEPIHLAETAQRVLDNISAGSGRDLTVRTTGSIPTVWADADRMSQVFTNLVENGLRHGQGQVDVSMAADTVDGASGLRILVDDEGEGVPHDIRIRVFTRFWRAGPSGGSGLGLYIVRGVVHSHGGSVVIESSPSGGARINVWLPINEPEVLRG